MFRIGDLGGNTEICQRNFAPKDYAFVIFNQDLELMRPVSSGTTVDGKTSGEKTC